jgi:hypothetical protein
MNSDLEPESTEGKLLEWKREESDRPLRRRIGPRENISELGPPL